MPSAKLGCCNAKEDEMTLNHVENIECIVQELDTKYVYPEMAQQINAHIQSQLEKYKAIDDAEAFAQAVTEDMQSVSHDKHLRLRRNPQLAASLLLQSEADDQAAIAKWIESLAGDNYGFRRVEWLAGAVGYLDIRLFAPPFAAGNIAVGAMAFLANAKALIFDLRKNGGGAPEMVQFIISYLFDDEIRHLNDIYIRPFDSTTHYWTLPYVPGKRMPDVDVYVLTSSNTFSGAEEFSYNLKAMERATLIGERTGGGAHPGRDFAIDDQFTLFVPGGRPINPITQTNWEGTGVTPHVEVPADDALKVAHKMALEKLIEKASTDEDRQFARQALNEAGLS
jgi:retinol-binding protein 3